MQGLPQTASAADWYAVIQHQLTTMGPSIGTMDRMIAAHAHALAIGTVLVTKITRHDARITAPLVLENWEREESALS